MVTTPPRSAAPTRAAAGGSGGGSRTCAGRSGRPSRCARPGAGSWAAAARTAPRGAGSPCRWSRRHLGLRLGGGVHVVGGEQQRTGLAGEFRGGGEAAGLDPASDGPTAHPGTLGRLVGGEVLEGLGGHVRTIGLVPRFGQPPWDRYVGRVLSERAIGP